MSGSKLSDRIVNMANDLIDRYLAHPFASQMVLTGEVNNGKEVMTAEYKIYKATGDDFTKLIEAGVGKAQSTEEKQLLEQMAVMVTNYVHRFETVFVAKFGDFDQRILAQLSTRDIPNYADKVDNLLNAPLLDFLVMFLGYFYCGRLLADLKFDPRFKPNWYYDFFVSDYNAYIGFVTALKTLIDIRGSGVSGDEERRLVDVFRTGFENQLAVNDLKWNAKVN